MTWAPWRPFSGKTRPGGPSGRKPRRGRDGCRPRQEFCSPPLVPAAHRPGVFTAVRAGRAPPGQPRVWPLLSLQLGKLRRGPWSRGGPVPLRTDLTPRGWTCLSQDECPMLPPEAVGLRRWRTLRHPRPQPPARPLTEPKRAARPAGTRERAGLECPRQAALAGRGAVRRRPAAREPVTALGCPLSWEWL